MHAAVFHLSKYYEFLDTVLLVAKRKPVIPLHLWHHASMPFVTWLWFGSPWLEVTPPRPVVQ